MRYVWVNTFSEQDCLRYACEIVSEYIDESLKKMLLEKLGLPLLQEKAGIKRKSLLDEDDTSNKKARYADDGTVMPTEDYGSANNAPFNNKVCCVDNPTKTTDIFLSFLNTDNL